MDPYRRLNDNVLYVCLVETKMSTLKIINLFIHSAFTTAPKSPEVCDDVNFSIHHSFAVCAVINRPDFHRGFQLWTNNRTEKITLILIIGWPDFFFHVYVCAP